MSRQNYKNHIRFYPPHHFVFYPVMILLTVASFYYASSYPDKQVEFILIGILCFVVTWLSFMLRQHYALGNQNRLVRLEMRLRYYQLTNTRLEQHENRLSFGQIAALRFASDEELPALLQRALSENLPADTIKKSIINWVPDEMRL